MAWKIVRRDDTAQGRDKAFISISKQSITFNARFIRVAKLESSKYVIIRVDSETFKLGFEFCEEGKPHSLKLSRTQKSPGLFCSGKSIARKYEWLKAVAKLHNIQERRFEPTQEGKFWVIQLCPAFETKRAREPANIPSDIQGIYRYLREGGEIVYIGRGDIRKRLVSPERKNWDFDAIEYSKLDNPDQQVKWEHYWIERYKDDHNRNLPFYNKISGIKENEGKNGVRTQ